MVFALAAVGRRVSVRQDGRTREVGMELYRAADADLVARFFTGG